MTQKKEGTKCGLQLIRGKSPNAYQPSIIFRFTFLKTIEQELFSITQCVATSLTYQDLMTQNCIAVEAIDNTKNYLINLKVNLKKILKSYCDENICVV